MVKLYIVKTPRIKKKRYYNKLYKGSKIQKIDKASYIIGLFIIS